MGHIQQSRIVTGGKDSIVNVLEPTYNVLSSFKMEDFLTKSIEWAIRSIDSRIRSVCLNENGTELVLGTMGSEIFLLRSKERNKGISEWSQEGLVVECLVRGHYRKDFRKPGKVSGLSVCSRSNSFCSCSEDGTVRMWSIEEKKQERVLIMADQDEVVFDQGVELNPVQLRNDELKPFERLTCIAISPDDSRAVVGCKDGSLRVILAQRGSHFILREFPEIDHEFGRV